MYSDIENTILVTHAGCMDGTGCAIMFRRAGGKKENIRYVSAGMLERYVKNEFQETDKFIIFADVGLTETGKQYAEVIEKRGRCVLLDHHQSSLFLKDKSWADLRQEHCGTELLRQYLGLEDKSSISLAALIKDHDLWLLQNPSSTRLAAFSVLVGQDVTQERFLNRDVSEQVFTETEDEFLKLAEARTKSLIESAIKKVVVRNVSYGPFKSFSAKVGYIISQEMNVSLLLNELLTQRNDIDVACQI